MTAVPPTDADRRPGRRDLRVGRRLGALIAITVVGISIAGPGARPVASAGPAATFGDPSAIATWGTGIEFEQPVSLTRDVVRAELLVSSPLEEGGFYVADEGPVEAGARTLVHLVEAGAGGIAPNTSLAGRWRITYEDGTRELGPSIGGTYRDTRFRWRTVAGEIVRVHWYEGDDGFGARALAIGEEAIKEAAVLLGVREEEPVDFFIYASEDAFYEALGPGTRENVGGQANPAIRTLFALIEPREIDAPWVGIVIPHELAHLVFDTTARNPYHYPPTWLNEGFATYLTQGLDADDRQAVSRAAADGSLMPLTALVGQFPTTRDRFSLAYAESASALDFMIRTHGREALVALIRSYGRGVSDDEAFTEALGMDVAMFEEAWLADLGAAPPIRHGPRKPSPGPLPVAWGGTASAEQTPGPGGATDDRVESAPLIALGVVAGIVALAVIRRRRSRAETRPGERSE